jgi:diguanylate cyclase (GGDEF)-like protein
MGMLRKTAAVVLWFLIFPCALLSVDLTPEERAYLDKLGTINVCVDPDWEPFEWLDRQGIYHGIGADLLAVVASRLGVKTHILKTKDWSQSIAYSKEGKCHIISFLNETPSRDEWLLFTNPHFSDPNVFITREEHPYINDPADLINETMVFPSGTAMEEQMRLNYPNIHVITTNSEKEAFSLVASRKADIAMRSLIVAAYIIKQEGWFNLKIAGKFSPLTNHLRMGVIKSEPMLRDILDKAIATLSETDRSKIINKYVSIKMEAARDYRILLAILFVLIVLGFALAWRNRQLKEHNKELMRLSQTDTLTQLYNRAKIEQELINEVKRAQVLGVPLTILLIDIDHFKQINDSFGHGVGDEVLVQFASLMKSVLRKGDAIGRWGGEEFLVLCKNTSENEAHNVALRMQEVIARHLFVTRKKHTISIGLATLREGDTPYMVISRADEALYCAKNNGRNKICFASNDQEAAVLQP